MEFGWSAYQQQYRDRLRTILSEELPADWWANYAYDGPSQPKVMEFARVFAERLISEALMVPHWPISYSGADFDAWAQIIINEEMWTAAKPRCSLYRGANWARPGVFSEVPGVDAGMPLEVRVSWIEQLRQVVIAAEAAGAMSVALELTVQHVKQRRQFGRPIGNNQAVQHCLAECAQIAEAASRLVLRAAWGLNAANAAVAALYVQEYLPRGAFDTHQFNGALGNTLEHTLHFFTYKPRALHAEAKGKTAHSHGCYRLGR